MLTPASNPVSPRCPRAASRGPLPIALTLLSILAGIADAAAPTAILTPPGTPPADTATPPSQARVALTPILSRPSEPNGPSSPDASHTNTPSSQPPFSARSYFRLDPVQTLLTWHGLDAVPTEGRILLSSWVRPRAASLDTERAPLFSDRTDIHLSSNIPGDHSPTQFKVAELQLADGIFFRTEGVGRSYTAETRYLTFSAEAYLAINERAGFAFGLDVLRTGIPEEGIGLPEDGIFARFQFDF
ncbi:hypothetical protein [Nodularia spumigena]|uniref:hypothetical protein n=1 Tax=Nodularia spumigena TaxID=70799 RepID=UPI002B1EB885|nr:hypothetical protein [Nodularia spumigena]MEA5557576.1 hypothetical protein [Nodularia spumigena CH309]